MELILLGNTRVVELISCHRAARLIGGLYSFRNSLKPGLCLASRATKLGLGGLVFVF